jgi:transcriptional regulator with XRE-family HTH domain
MTGSHYNIIDVQVGARVRRARIFRDFRQHSVADHLGVSAEAYLDLEKGGCRFTAVQLLQLSRLFQVSPAYFLGAPEEFAPNRQIANDNVVFRPRGVI